MRLMARSAQLARQWQKFWHRSSAEVQSGDYQAMKDEFTRGWFAAQGLHCLGQSPIANVYRVTDLPLKAWDRDDVDYEELGREVERSPIRRVCR